MGGACWHGTRPNVNTLFTYWNGTKARTPPPYTYMNVASFPGSLPRQNYVRPLTLRAVGEPGDKANDRILEYQSHRK